MRIAVSDAKARLTELVRLAEAGEEVTLTRDGREILQLVPVVRAVTAAERDAAVADARAYGRAHASDGPSAARGQDFLYDEDGLPE